jgi:carboxyl-terminal processing protease
MVATVPRRCALDDHRVLQRWLLVCLCGGILCLSRAQAASAKNDLLRQADQLEQQGRWSEAADKYDLIPPRERDGDIRGRYLSCLRRAHLLQRHGDASYRQMALTLDLATALKAYDEVLGKLQSTYVDPAKADLTRLFRDGLQELRFCLSDDAFRQEYLPGAASESVHAFVDRLGATWGAQSVRTRKDAERLVRDVALAAQQSLGVRAPLVALELACGACNNLDEYTCYLTPRQLDETYAAFKGELVGVGINDLAADGDKLVVKAVVPTGAAARQGIQVDDRIARIDQQSVEKLSPDAALERLRGEPGTSVELELAGRQPRTITLVREAMMVPSVSASRLLEDGIGYIQLVGFQETTVEEMEKAIADLKIQGMKVLILDLRGNPGGLFDVAVQIAERFLSEGVVVATRGQIEAQNRTIQAGNPGALAIPLVVLVNSDTASAAEVVAGALKENRRATLVGQATYGKGSVQCVVKLDSLPAGIRITLAKFFSPLGRAYQGNGISPHVVVARTSPAFDEQQEAARQEARQLIPIRR